MSRRGRDANHGSESGETPQAEPIPTGTAAPDSAPGAVGNGDTGDPADPDEVPVFVVPIEESIDLHTFQPREVLDVVDAYLDAALERGFLEVRLIHGRGKGVQRANVQKRLAKDPRVERYADAPAHRGGWGATLVWLHAPQPAASDAGDGD